MCASSDDELQSVDSPLINPPVHEPLTKDHNASSANVAAWLQEMLDYVNQWQGPHPSATVSPSLSPDPDPDWISRLEALVPAEDIIIPNLSLNAVLYSHPCRVSTSFQRNVIYAAGAPVWGRLLAELSHLIYQHVKSNQMGTSVPQSVFNRVREMATTRLARSPYILESITSNELDTESNESIHLSWRSPVFCERVLTHLEEVARTARESACRKAIYFICEESDHLGIVPSGLDDAGKEKLLARMEFTAEHGCMFLHEFTKDGIEWFGNTDFALILKRSLYDVTCLGWCGALGEMRLPDANTVCQLTEPSPYVIALQITWLVTVARFYLETKLERSTTSRPTKRRAVGVSQPNVPNPFLEWTESLNGKVICDINTVFNFIIGLSSPMTSSCISKIGVKEMQESIQKIKLYTDYISRPPYITHYGSLGSFIYADPPPLTISDQSILNSAVTFP